MGLMAGDFPIVPNSRVRPGEFYLVQPDRKVVIHAMQDGQQIKIEGEAAARVVADLRRATEQRIAQAIFGKQGQAAEGPQSVAD